MAGIEPRTSAIESVHANHLTRRSFIWYRVSSVIKKKTILKWIHSIWFLDVDIEPMNIFLQSFAYLIVTVISFNRCKKKSYRTTFRGFRLPSLHRVSHCAQWVFEKCLITVKLLFSKENDVISNSSKSFKTRCASNNWPICKQKGAKRSVKM